LRQIVPTTANVHRQPVPEAVVNATNYRVFNDFYLEPEVLGRIVSDETDMRRGSQTTIMKTTKLEVRNSTAWSPRTTLFLGLLVVVATYFFGGF
jgi:hypothetical protein